MALHVCHDLTCWLSGADERIAELRARYGDDVEVELVEVSCLGRCDAAPAVAVDEEPAHVDGADELVDAARSGSVPEAEALRVRPGAAGRTIPTRPATSATGCCAPCSTGRCPPEAVLAA